MRVLNTECESGLMPPLADGSRSRAILGADARLLVERSSGTFWKSASRPLSTHPLQRHCVPSVLMLVYCLINVSLLAIDVSRRYATDVPSSEASVSASLAQCRWAAGNESQHGPWNIICISCLANFVPLSSFRPTTSRQLLSLRHCNPAEIMKLLRHEYARCNTISTGVPVIENTTHCKDMREI